MNEIMFALAYLVVVDVYFMSLDRMLVSGPYRDRTFKIWLAMDARVLTRRLFSLPSC